jgi:hypothetical protein
MYVGLQVLVPLPQQLVHRLKVPDWHHRMEVLREQLPECIMHQPVPRADPVVLIIIIIIKAAAL